MKSVTMNILDVTWTFRVISDSAFTKKYGKNTEAVTLADESQVDFRRSRVLPRLIRHELLHVLVASSNVNSAQLTRHQFEELLCEITETHHHRINMITEQLLEIFLPYVLGGRRERD